MVLKKATKLELIKQFSNLSLSKIVEEKYPAIASLKRSYGIETVDKINGIILGDLSHSFNGELSKDVIEEITAELSTSILKNLSLEDVYLVCRQIKYEDHNRKLSIGKVLKALNKHFDAKSTLIMETNYNQHVSLKSSSNTPRQSQLEKQKHHDAKLWYLNRK